ncbi:MAG: TIGR00730 family Rossman fold protein [Methanobrevibacter sp.]|nr:TIGR00730 family Rossman fold protein [Methanobrevibacter sp.]
MNICLYGAGSTDIKAKYIEDGYHLGEEIAKRGHKLVFGGGDTGIMGAVSKGVLENDGEILGIAPEWIDYFEALRRDCTEFIYTETMDERKKLFLEHSDCFIIAPGGIGTMDEFFEALTLRALERHDKKIVLFNSNGYYDKMLEMFEYMEDEGVMRNRNRKALFVVKNTVEEVLDYLEE